jgi:hypothetical protein
MTTAVANRIANAWQAGGKAIALVLVLVPTTLLRSSGLTRADENLFPDVDVPRANRSTR